MPLTLTSGPGFAPAFEVVERKGLDHPDPPDEVVVNSTAGPHLTVTGTSAEAGDAGQVGRGNRFGG